MRELVRRLVWSVTWMVGTALGAQDSAESTDPREILESMAARYASLESYEDEGVVISKTPVRGRKTPFQICFKRPGRFRFQWTTVHSIQPYRAHPFNHEIRCDGSQVWVLVPENGSFEGRRAVSEAIAEAASASSGSAHTVPQMLLENVDGFSLTQLTGLELVRREMFEGVSCWVIRGDHPTTTKWTYTLWIGAADGLLRKMDFKLGEEIHRNIRTDQGIDDTQFGAPDPEAR